MTKILVIEDEEFVRENILDLLDAEDFEALAASNGRIGLDLAISEVPDLILCDLMLPELDGYSVLQSLRSEPITATIPFIFLTARSARSDFRLGMDLGADDYITKPFTRSELLSAISSRLVKKATFDKYLSSDKSSQKYYHEFEIIKISLQRTLEQREFAQFQIYYQPQVNITTGEIIAAESSLSWQSPEFGMVSAAELFSLAETTGLIIPISEWLLHSICKQSKIWHDAGFSSLRIAVNLSAHQLAQPDFSQSILKFIESYNLKPHCLELDFKESIIMQDTNSTIAVIEELQSLGVQIGIDDFGTGYTSLIYLKKLPINTLKINRYFIHNIANDPQKSAITTALIQMAHNLNFHVVAEGVETKAELDFLRQYNCDAMQGYLFSCPLPLVEFEKLLLSNQRLAI